MMSDLAQWITSKELWDWMGFHSGIFTFCGVIVATWGIWANTSRAKKELAVNLVDRWATYYTLEMKHAFDLAEDLGHEVIAAISAPPHDATYVTVRGEKAVAAVNRILRVKDSLFPVMTEEDDPNTLLLSMHQCRIIDYEWSSTLNRIEAILIAIDTRAAQRRIAKKAFQPLLDSRGPVLNKLTSPPNAYFPVIRRALKRNGHTELTLEPSSPEGGAGQSPHS
jgi:hypothetical protein